MDAVYQSGARMNIAAVAKIAQDRMITGSWFCDILELQGWTSGMVSGSD